MALEQTRCKRCAWQAMGAIILCQVAMQEAFLFKPLPALSRCRHHATALYVAQKSKDWKQALMDEDGLDIEAIIEENKQTLPSMPDASAIGPLKSKMQGLKSPPVGDEETRRAAQNARLTEWLGNNGVWMSDRSGWVLSSKTVDEIEQEDSGRGLICKDPINMGNALFQLPMKIVMDKEKALEIFKGALPADVNEYFAVALMLIREKALGAASSWSPYIDVLPTIDEVNPTLIWSEEDLSLLTGSSLVAATRSLKNKLQAEFAGLQDRYMQDRPDMFPSEIFTFEAYLWAFINVFSRAIRVSLPKGERIIMCPYADLINHNPFANTYIVSERPFKPFNPIRGEEVITIYADKDYKKMEQVYISYGPKANSDLLLLYGFCLDRNPFNSVEIRVNLREDDPLFEEKRRFLARAGVRESEAFPLYADRYPNELLEYLRLVQVVPGEVKDGSLSEMEFVDPVSMQNELGVLASIESACMEALNNYPTSEADDAGLIDDMVLFATLPKTQRMAIKHRRSEKRILKKTSAAVRQRFVNLKSGRQPLRVDDDN